MRAPFCRPQPEPSHSQGQRNHSLCVLDGLHCTRNLAQQSPCSVPNALVVSAAILRRDRWLDCAQRVICSWAGTEQQNLPTALQNWQIWNCLPESAFFVDAVLQLRSGELLTSYGSAQHHNPLGLPCILPKVFCLLRLHTSFVPDSGLALVELDACDPEQCSSQRVVDELHPIRLTQRVDIVEECALAVLLEATPLTPLPELPGYRLKTTMASKGRLAPLLQLEQGCVSGLHHPTNYTWTVQRTTSARMARWTEPLAFSPTCPTWQRATHDRTRQCHRRSELWRTHPCLLRLSTCGRHSRSSSGRQIILERCTLLLEFCQELFCKRPGNESPE